MGDRGNIKVGNVYLYTHWGGSSLPYILKNALIKGKSRWNDEAYLTRIIFCEMLNNSYDTSEEALNETTGFGISTEIQDNEHEILEVDCFKQEVSGIKFEEFVK